MINFLHYFWCKNKTQHQLYIICKKILDKSIYLQLAATYKKDNIVVNEKHKQQINEWYLLVNENQKNCKSLTTTIRFYLKNEYFDYQANIGENIYLIPYNGQYELYVQYHTAIEKIVSNNPHLRIDLPSQINSLNQLINLYQKLALEIKKHYPNKYINQYKNIDFDKRISNLIKIIFHEIDCSKEELRQKFCNKEGYCESNWYIKNTNYLIKNFHLIKSHKLYINKDKKNCFKSLENIEHQVQIYIENGLLFDNELYQQIYHFLGSIDLYMNLKLGDKEVYISIILRNFLKYQYEDYINIEKKINYLYSKTTLNHIFVNKEKVNYYHLFKLVQLFSKNHLNYLNDYVLTINQTIYQIKCDDLEKLTSYIEDINVKHHIYTIINNIEAFCNKENKSKDEQYLYNSLLELIEDNIFQGKILYKKKVKLLDFKHLIKAYKLINKNKKL